IARRHDLPGEFVTHHQRRLDAALRPRVPVGDVDVRAAHPGVPHRDVSAMWTSVPHTPACRTAMSTSPGPGDGFGTVATFRPGTRCSLTMAFMETRDAGMRDAGCVRKWIA